jgi:hypothetical protein
MPRDYYVYVHKDQHGNVFYIGKGTGKRAWSKERDDVWQRYVKEKIGGRYEVEIVEKELSEDEAVQLENFIMQRYGNRLLNLVTPSGQIIFTPRFDEGKLNVESTIALNATETELKENERYWALFNSNKEFIAATKAFEATDLEGAVARYRDALLKARECYEIQQRIHLSSGLRGEWKILPRRCEVKLLDRLTLCLTKLNRGSEAVTEAERYFADFPDDRYSSLGQGIIKRIERIKAASKSA